MNRRAGAQTQLGAIQVGIFILTLFTAFAHLYLWMQPDEALRIWFLLNGLGYLVLLAAFFLPQFTQIHHLVSWTLLGYALLTIILWFFLGSPREGKLDPFDLSVKGVETVLVVLLFINNARAQ